MIRNDEEVAARESEILKISMEAADQADIDTYIEDGDGTMWFVDGLSRGEARAYYAAEMGFDFTKVAVHREYMKVNRQAIREVAYDLARDAEYESPTIAYSWEGEGWLWSICKKGDADAVALWRCEGMA